MPRIRFVLCLLLGLTSPLAAQSSFNLGLELSAGMVSTTGNLTGSPRTAALFRLGAVQKGAERRVRFRLDTELWLAPGERSSSRGPGFGALVVNYGVMLGPRRQGVAPYALVAAGGIAGYGEGNEYGFAGLTGRIGGGVRGRLGRQTVHAELAVTTSLSPAGQGTWRSLAWPISVGIVF